MKTIVVISDTHGFFPQTNAFYEILDESDLIFHLGDGLNEIKTLSEMYPQKFHSVFGNCDSMTTNDKEIVVENVKFLLTHGHEYGVKKDLLNLSFACAEHNATVGLYGHTHCPAIDKISGITLINPGSLCFSRTYCFVTVVGDKAYARNVQL